MYSPLLKNTRSPQTSGPWAKQWHVHLLQIITHKAPCHRAHMPGEFRKRKTSVCFLSLSVPSFFFLWHRIKQPLRTILQQEHTENLQTTLLYFTWQMLSSKVTRTGHKQSPFRFCKFWVTLHTGGGNKASHQQHSLLSLSSSDWSLTLSVARLRWVERIECSDQISIDGGRKNQLRFGTHFLCWAAVKVQQHNKQTS